MGQDICGCPRDSHTLAAGRIHKTGTSVALHCALWEVTIGFQVSPHALVTLELQSIMVKRLEVLLRCVQENWALSSGYGRFCCRDSYD
jgi:hypothetical protein